ncbi:hypothetical protein OIU84_005795 [Salix udensis]|uniref:Uncharacterized protein n=1 Tax=Salix udensis TaxID=889485 RepID=A0AAD6JWV2_9ROSI|nr:hypothetical protein OIU84_005795 [Salix udensis]
MSIIASASCRVHQQIPGITRIRTLGIDPRTGRCSLKRCLLWTLEIAIFKRVCCSPSQETSQVDYHAIKANIIVGCHHWGVLWAINWLVEWPRTLTGALSLGVTNPNVGKFRSLTIDFLSAHRRPMGTTCTRAKPFNSNIG